MTTAAETKPSTAAADPVPVVVEVITPTPTTDLPPTVFSTAPVPSQEPAHEKENGQEPRNPDACLVASPPVAAPAEKPADAAAAAGLPAPEPSGPNGKQTGLDEVNPQDFSGEVQTNNDLPSATTLRRIENYTVLDRHGKSHTFRSLYSGRSVARRVLVIFVRHFFCGEYLRSLTASITPEALLRLPISTFIAVIGCGDPGLIDMYVRETACPFPVYADPTRRLYDELGMVRTLAMGQRPAYMRKSMISSVLSSVAQGLRQIPTGKATKAGDQRQIGGEFLFEPLSVHTPADEVDRRIGEHQDYRSSVSRLAVGDHLGDSGDKQGSDDHADLVAAAVAAAAAAAPTPAATTAATTSNGSLSVVTSGSGSAVPGAPPAARARQDDEDEDEGFVEEKQVTWCHRMRTTRDHAEIPELMEVLGLDGQGMPIKDKKRWSRALETRKGTGLSLASQMSAMSGSAKSLDGRSSVGMA